MRALIGLTVLVGFITPAWAQSSCATLTDQNQMWYCRARAENKSSYCASITDSDLRRLCSAQTGHPNDCASIIDQQKRHFCQGVTGR